MGLFGKLFEKKECSICGGEIGLLGNRKLEDGNCCKHCAAKLSPWFDDRRHSTVEQIKAQLEYREQNRELVNNFHVTREFGEHWKLQVDEKAGLFLIARTDNIQEENPDVLKLSQITDVDYDVDEDRTELMDEDKDGNRVSYSPRRYHFDYNFYITIKVDHPFFDDMRFRVNHYTVEVEPRPSRGFMLTNNDGREAYEFKTYDRQVNDIRDYLLTVSREETPVPVSETAPQEEIQTPAIPKFCPNCGAPTEGGKFCGSCGSKLA